MFVCTSELERVVQLAAADEHGADLGQLAGVAGQAVRLGVDGEELRRRQRLGEDVHPGVIRRGPDGVGDLVHVGSRRRDPEEHPATAGPARIDVDPAMRRRP